VAPAAALLDVNPCVYASNLPLVTFCPVCANRWLVSPDATPVIQLVIRQMKITNSYTAAPPGSRLQCSDRYGHVLPKAFQEQDRSALVSSQPETHARYNDPLDCKRLVRRILVPVDVLRSRPEQFRTIFLIAHRFNARVIFVHGYVAPPCFDFAVGPDGLQAARQHCLKVRNEVSKFGAGARRFYRLSRAIFLPGAPVTVVLKASHVLRTDLIAMGMGTGWFNHCWTMKEFVTEVVRRAECPVLAFRMAAQS
jgi:nucleotide-binding universal stress UspA family protein